jgi:hypothetical protein
MARSVAYTIITGSKTAVKNEHRFTIKLSEEIEVLHGYKKKQCNEKKPELEICNRVQAKNGLAKNHKFLLDTSSIASFACIAPSHIIIDY